ncbi:hypothetical protein AGMMS49587_18920 [Spirochaetia bacterium]|nr:hypothetical protein AGMMS49587_18920 [Spirochaetia bacterium]
MTQSPVLMVSHSTFFLSDVKKLFHYVVVKCADVDGVELNRVIKEVNPKMVFLDSGFYVDGPRRIGLLLKKFPKLKITILNMDSIEPEDAVKFLLFGAKNYINLREGFELFKEGLQMVLEGEEYISPEEDKVYEKLYGAPIIRPDITMRQEEVKQLLFKGWTNKKIAAELGLSEKTVTNHLNAIYKKFNVKNKNELFCKFPGGMNDY